MHIDFLSPPFILFKDYEQPLPCEESGMNGEFGSSKQNTIIMVEKNLTIDAGFYQKCYIFDTFMIILLGKKNK